MSKKMVSTQTRATDVHFTSSDIYLIYSFTPRKLLKKHPIVLTNGKETMGKLCRKTIYNYLGLNFASI